MLISDIGLPELLTLDLVPIANGLVLLDELQALIEAAEPGADIDWALRAKQETARSVAAARARLHARLRDAR